MLVVGEVLLGAGRKTGTCGSAFFDDENDGGTFRGARIAERGYIRNPEKSLNNNQSTDKPHSYIYI